MTLYLDTSALIKLLVDEPGADLARSAFDESPTASTSTLAYVETRSALARMQVGGRLTEAAHQAAGAEFEDLWADLATAGVELKTITAAAELAEAHGLRAYDAVHLSTAITVNDEDPVTFACWDDDLRAAAAAEGLELLPAKT